LVNSVKNTTATQAAPIVIDLMVLLGAAYCGGQIMSRLDSIEEIIKSRVNLSDRIIILEESRKVDEAWRHGVDSKLAELLERKD